jgi:hypothetical protein
MFDYKKIFRNREARLKLIDSLKFIPTKPYLKLVYKIKTGKALNLDSPVGFCEKLQWLKIHDIHPEYTQLVDKTAVRDYITEKIGEDYLFPLLGSWEKFEDIDFDSLPDKFVLKCNHDSGSVKIITDKSQINKDELSAFFNGRLKLNPYNAGREYPYKDVKPLIMAEKFMESSDGKGINDYKFFCFDGKPEIMFVATDRAVDVRFDFYDMSFNHLPIYNIHPNSDGVVEKPKCFDEMKQLCEKLTKGMKFVRLDLYEIDGKVYFGEFTFFHGGGFYLFEPDEWEKKLGDLIKI